MTPEQERLVIQINEDFEEYHRDVNAGLRIKRVPTGPGFRLRDLDWYAEFLDSGLDAQAEFMSTVNPDEVEFYERLLISRAEFEIAEERGQLPLTQDRIDRHPERYRWEPDT
ncbi:hypothetical protein [Rhizobium ruizarguesonis]|uniref:hypothetical protein n=1 Tax=Rhizobium ruizarguesonis TaxID=2081791 RepID=UPI001030F154|nr:hypothetical protein [Rhizobium ruizarguesonis]TAV14709.1 hypothetical protein ELI34_04165 [Rhizobium ruizarguesonis]